MNYKMILNKLINRMPNFSRRNYQVIYFHEVTRGQGDSYDFINLDTFKKNIEFLYANNFNTLTFEELNNPEVYLKSKNNVLITFDDGYINNYHLVFPLMKKYNLKFNVFLEAGAINKKSNYLTWDMVNEMIDSKIVGFGAHTYNHIDARYITDSNIDEEIIYSNKLIKEKTNLNVEDFCFPFGMYDCEIIELLNGLDVYKRLYTSDGIKVKMLDNSNVIGRVGIQDEDDLKTFIGKVTGKYNIFYNLNRKIKSKQKKYLKQVFKKSKLINKGDLNE